MCGLVASIYLLLVLLVRLQSNFHRSVCRMFPSRDKRNDTRTSRRRRWQRLSLPTFTVNPTKRWSRPSSSGGGSPKKSNKIREPFERSFERSLSYAHDYHGPPACHPQAATHQAAAHHGARSARHGARSDRHGAVGRSQHAAAQANQSRVAAAL